MVLLRIKWRQVSICVFLTFVYIILFSYTIMDDTFEILYSRNAFEELSEVRRKFKLRTRTPVSNLGNTTIVPAKLEAELNKCVSPGCISYELLIIVKSFVLNYGKRNVIRQTWGKKKNELIQTIFVIGEYKEDDALLSTELRSFNDIIVFKLEDKYENLVYKTMYAMQWIIEKRIRARFFHFIDDDRFLNVKNLLNAADKHLLQSDTKIIGYKIPWSKPRRKPKHGKNVLTKEDYPYRYYPPYIIGGTLLTNFRTINMMVQTFPLIKPISVEDCFIGLVSYALSIELVHDSDFLPSLPSSDVMYDIISAPGYDQPYQLLTAWDKFAKSDMI